MTNATSIREPQQSEKHEVTPEAAIARGWAIFPCGINRRPHFDLLTRVGAFEWVEEDGARRKRASWKRFQERQPTAEEMRVWLAARPPAWAVVTGAVSGIITLDFDTKDGAGGAESYLTLSRHWWEQGIPAEAHRRTGSGGYHLDLIHPGWPVKTLNTQKNTAPWAKDWPGLDIRADGGYVIFHGRNEAGEYCWEREPEPFPLEILPAALRELLGLMRAPVDEQPKSERPTVVSDVQRVDWRKLLDDAVSRVPSMGRDNAGFHLACQLRDNGYSDESAAAMAQYWVAQMPPTNTKGQREAYTTADFVKSVRQAYSRAPREPWGPPRSTVLEMPNGATRPANHVQSTAQARPEAADSEPAGAEMRTEAPPADAPAAEQEPGGGEPPPDEPPGQPRSDGTAKSARLAENQNQGQATKLLKMVAGQVEFFHDPGGKAYGSMIVDDHQETHLLKSEGFKSFLQRLYYASTKGSLSTKSLNDALGTMRGWALWDGPEHEVYCRVGRGADGAIYLDLCNDRWEAVEITGEGWSVCPNPPVKFRRAPGMLPLPLPARSRSGADLLKKFINAGGHQVHPVRDDDDKDTGEVKHTDDFGLIVAWLLGSLNPRGPYPVLVLNSEQNSGKSTASKVLRALIDPNRAPLRSLPKDERDLVITASNSRVICLDNISHIPDWLSDAICRIATGGGFATRQLHTDEEETIFNVSRPQILNGIEEIATRADLMDRALVVELPAIPEDQRKPEREFWAEFERHQPAMLGYLLDAAVAALSNEKTTKLPRLPRMADFALFVTAAEAALGWEDGHFMRVYDTNRSEAVQVTLDASPIAKHLRAMLNASTRLSEDHQSQLIEMTATEILDDLNKRATEGERKLPNWPKLARSASNAIRRIVPPLRAVGVKVEFERAGKERSRVIRISQKARQADEADAKFPGLGTEGK